VYCIGQNTAGGIITGVLCFWPRCIC